MHLLALSTILLPSAVLVAGVSPVPPLTPTRTMPASTAPAAGPEGKVGASAVTTYYPARDLPCGGFAPYPHPVACDARVRVNPSYDLATVLIYPPPMAVAARAYFSPGVQVSLDGTAENVAPTVVNTSQDRLWIDVLLPEEQGQEAAGAGTCGGDMMQPCPGLTLTPLNETGTADAGGPFFGVLLKGRASIATYVSCLRRLTYQNIAAFPCTPSAWDMDPRVVRCDPSPTAVRMQEVQAGPRMVAIDVLTVVEQSNALPPAFPSPGSTDGQAVLVLQAAVADGQYPLPCDLPTGLPDNCAADMGWEDSSSSSSSSSPVIWQKPVETSAIHGADEALQPAREEGLTEEEQARVGSEPENDPYTKPSSGVRVLTVTEPALALACVLLCCVLPSL